MRRMKDYCRDLVAAILLLVTIMMFSSCSSQKGGGDDTQIQVTQDTLTLAGKYFLMTLTGDSLDNSAYMAYDNEGKRVFTGATSSAGNHVNFYRYFYTGEQVDSIHYGSVLQKYGTDWFHKGVLAAIEGKGTTVNDSTGYTVQDRFTLLYNKEGKLVKVFEPGRDRQILAPENGEIYMTLKRSADFWTRKHSDGYHLVFDARGPLRERTDTIAVYDRYRPLMFASAEEVGTADSLTDYYWSTVLKSQFFLEYPEIPTHVHYIPNGLEARLSVWSEYNGMKRTMTWKGETPLMDEVLSQDGKLEHRLTFINKGSVMNVKFERSESQKPGINTEEYENLGLSDIEQQFYPDGVFPVTELFKESFGFEYKLDWNVRINGIFTCETGFINENDSELERLFMETAISKYPALIKRLSHKVAYPYKMYYPIADLQNEQDFMEAFPLLLDSSLVEDMRSMSEENWTIDYEGDLVYEIDRVIFSKGKLKDIPYISEEYYNLREKKANEEKLKVHKDYQNISSPCMGFVLEDGKMYGRLDYIIPEKDDEFGDNHCRLLLFKNDSSPDGYADLELDGARYDTKDGFFFELGDNNGHYILYADYEVPNRWILSNGFLERTGKESYLIFRHWDDIINEFPLPEDTCDVR